MPASWSPSVPRGPKFPDNKSGQYLHAYKPDSWNPSVLRVLLFDQAVKLSFTSKDGEDDEPDQPDQPDEPCEQNWSKWKKPPPGPGSDSAPSLPTYIHSSTYICWPYSLSIVERSSRVPTEIAIWSSGGFLFVAGVASGDPFHSGRRVWPLSFLFFRHRQWRPL